MSETPLLPLVPSTAPPDTGEAPGGPVKLSPHEVRVVYVRYRDPNPLEFPGRPERLAGPIFHAAGILLRENSEFLALGEVAFSEENEPFVRRYGADLFPAYRNILTVPKGAIVERRDVVVRSDGSSHGAD